MEAEVNDSPVVVQVAVSFGDLSPACSLGGMSCAAQRGTSVWHMVCAKFYKSSNKLLSHDLSAFN